MLPILPNDAKAEAPVLWPPHPKSWLIGKDSEAGRGWGQEEKGTTEDEMAGWHHWLDGRESEWTLGVGDGQGGPACCDSWCRKESDTTEQLNWLTDQFYLQNLIQIQSLSTFHPLHHCHLSQLPSKSHVNYCNNKLLLFFLCKNKSQLVSLLLRVSTWCFLTKCPKWHFKILKVNRITPLPQAFHDSFSHFKWKLSPSDGLWTFIRCYQTTPLPLWILPTLPLLT